MKYFLPKSTSKSFIILCCVYVCACMCVCMCANVCMCVRVCMHMCKHACMCGGQRLMSEAFLDHLLSDLFNYSFSVSASCMLGL